MDLILMRHPEVAVEAGLCYGQTDVPLQRDAREFGRARYGRERPGQLMGDLLRIVNLGVEFHVQSGVVRAVDGVSLRVRPARSSQ